MTIKRISLLLFTAIVSISCVGIMNIHYDVLSRYTYDISESDAEKLRTHLTYKEINYLIDYSISSDLFIEYIEQDGFNVYHFPLYNRIKDLVGDSLSNGQIVYYAEKAIKEDIDEDDLINYVGMGYEVGTIISFKEQSGLLNKDVLAIDPLNYDYRFKDNETVYTLVPYDLKVVDFLVNSNDITLRNGVANQLNNLIIKIDSEVKYNVYNSVEITNGFETYETTAATRKTDGRNLTPGKNYYQLGRMFTLARYDRYEEDFFKMFDQYAGDYGFICTDVSTNEYLYIGK